MRKQNQEGLDNRFPKVNPHHEPSRRQFLGLLGTGATASVGISAADGVQEIPVISMGNNYFDPIGLFVEPGTTVWFEIEAGSHSATAYSDRIPSDATPFDSNVISEGRFEHTFDTPGTHDYYCIPHKSMGMVGRIVVGAPGGPAEDDPIPDGAVPESETIIEEGTVTFDEFDESGEDAGGGMIGSRPGMMNRGGPGWMVLIPIGFLITVLGFLSGVAYWASRRGSARIKRNDSAIAILREQYARGEIDEEEYTRRKRQLQQESHDGK